MRKRYFYQLGHFEPTKHELYIMEAERELDERMYKTINSKGPLQHLLFGLTIDLKKYIPQPEPIPNIFNHMGRDIRRWTLKNEFTEVGEEMYNIICEQETKIIMEKGMVAANIKHWHNPFELNDTDIEKELKTRFNLDEVIINELN